MVGGGGEVSLWGCLHANQIFSGAVNYIKTSVFSQCCGSGMFIPDPDFNYRPRVFSKLQQSLFYPLSLKLLSLGGKVGVCYFKFKLNEVIEL